MKRTLQHSRSFQQRRQVHDARVQLEQHALRLNTCNEEDFNAHFLELVHELADITAMPAHRSLTRMCTKLQSELNSRWKSQLNPNLAKDVITWVIGQQEITPLRQFSSHSCLVEIVLCCVEMWEVRHELSHNEQLTILKALQLCSQNKSYCNRSLKVLGNRFVDLFRNLNGDCELILNEILERWDEQYLKENKTVGISFQNLVDANIYGLFMFSKEVPSYTWETIFAGNMVNGIYIPLVWMVLREPNEASQASHYINSKFHQPSTSEDYIHSLSLLLALSSPITSKDRRFQSVQSAFMEQCVQAGITTKLVQNLHQLPSFHPKQGSGVTEQLSKTDPTIDIQLQTSSTYELDQYQTNLLQENLLSRVQSEPRVQNILFELSNSRTQNDVLQRALQAVEERDTNIIATKVQDQSNTVYAQTVTTIPMPTGSTSKNQKETSAFKQVEWSMLIRCVDLECLTWIVTSMFIPKWKHLPHPKLSMLCKDLVGIVNRNFTIATPVNQLNLSAMATKLRKLQAILSTLLSLNSVQHTKQTFNCITQCLKFLYNAITLYTNGPSQAPSNPVSSVLLQSAWISSCLSNEPYLADQLHYFLSQYPGIAAPCILLSYKFSLFAKYDYEPDDVVALVLEVIEHGKPWDQVGVLDTLYVLQTRSFTNARKPAKQAREIVHLTLQQVWLRFPSSLLYCGTIDLEREGDLSVTKNESSCTKEASNTTQSKSSASKEELNGTHTTSVATTEASNAISLLWCLFWMDILGQSTSPWQYHILNTMIEMIGKQLDNSHEDAALLASQAILKITARIAVADTRSNEVNKEAVICFNNLSNLLEVVVVDNQLRRSNVREMIVKNITQCILNSATNQTTVETVLALWPSLNLVPQDKTACCAIDTVLRYGTETQLEILYNHFVSSTNRERWLSCVHSRWLQLNGVAKPGLFCAECDWSTSMSSLEVLEHLSACNFSNCDVATRLKTTNEAVIMLTELWCSAQTHRTLNDLVRSKLNVIASVIETQLLEQSTSIVDEWSPQLGSFHITLSDAERQRFQLPLMLIVSELLPIAASLQAPFVRLLKSLTLLHSKLDSLALCIAMRHSVAHGITTTNLAVIPKLVSGFVLNVDLSNVGLDHRRCVIVGGWLSRNDCTVRKLILQRNAICARGLAALSDSLRSNRTLQVLDLESNNICTAGEQDSGMIALAETLIWNKTLQVLDISQNILSRSGLNAFLRALSVNSSLVRVKLDGTCVTTIQVAAIATKVAENSSALLGEVRMNTNPEWSNNVLSGRRVSVANETGNGKSMVKLPEPQIHNSTDFENHDGNVLAKNGYVVRPGNKLNVKDPVVAKLRQELDELEQELRETKEKERVLHNRQW